MKCPHCGKAIKLPESVYTSADVYSESRLVATQCCGELVSLIPIRSFKVFPYTGPRKEDDWGVERKAIRAN